MPISGTHLGSRGYTIPRGVLTPEQIRQMERDLAIEPYAFGAPKIPGADIIPKFYAFRTVPDPAGRLTPKYIVPYFYGVSKFGPTTAPSKIGIGEPMAPAATRFNGQLRDYQVPVIAKFLEHCRADPSAPMSGGLLELFCAWGKTGGGLYIAANLGRKTLVIVHKEFLMNQWIERIQQFLPGARIGRIQGPVVETEGCDIVLCMLQSLIQKNYPSDLFTQFGFTIIDEVHHIGSQTFSNALFKVVTRYMLGLSATMNRKDGTTHVFKMFLGDVVYKTERTFGEHDVEIRAIHYRPPPRHPETADFSTVEKDGYDNVKISTMINKLCDFSPRTEFILQVLCDHLRVDGVNESDAAAHKAAMDAAVPPCVHCGRNDVYPVRLTCCGAVQYCMRCLDTISDETDRRQFANTRCPLCASARTQRLRFEQAYVPNPHVKPREITQTLVMAQNLNVLEYLYHRIVNHNLASVAYYVGGMSETELKQSEQAQVILATYSMSSEGLDIPTLTTEFLITPKSDIVQSLGRMLRAKHSVTRPTAYDFVDIHETFQNQWKKKRRPYYKKQGYRIVTIDSDQYAGTETAWRVFFDAAAGIGRGACGSVSDSDESNADDNNDTEKNKQRVFDPKKTGNGVCLFASFRRPEEKK